MADRIASGEIHIEVNDREAIASLHRIDAEFDKEMAKLERQKADVKLGGDLDDLKRSIKEAEARVKAYDEKIKRSENNRSKAQLKRQRDKADLDKRFYENELYQLEKVAKAEKGRNKELDITAKRLELIARREEKIAKVSEKVAKQQKAEARDRMRDINREANRRKGLNDQRLREEKADERAANAMRREQAMVPKLERSYMRLQDRLEKLAQAKGKAGKDQRAHILIEVEEHDTHRELERIKNRIRNAVGRDPIGLPAKPVIGRDAGRRLRLDFENNNRQLGPAAAAAGLRIGRTMGQKVTQGFRNMTERGGIIANTRALGSALGGAAGRGATSGLSRIGHAFDGLANMTVRLGPFTSTIRQLMVAMSLLGPMVIDVVGALGSLVSVVGSGALGLANLGTAIVGGGIPALIGMVTVLKPVVGEMKNATKASQNYQKAVREYGKDSPEAAKKLDIFNNVMKHQTKETKANFLAAGKLKDAWAKVTEPSRAKTFDLMGKGLKYLTNNVGFFGKRTNDTFTAVHSSMDRWLNGLKSAEGHQVLGTMMDNFNNALGPALDGLGNLVAVFARFGASASRYLPDIMAKFQDWSHGLLDGSKNADVVNGKVDRMMSSLKSVGRFLMATGRLLVAFFRGGVDAGTKFTDTMTNAMTRWTKFLNTTEGQNKLGDFFSEAVSGAETLWGFLAPLVKGFFEWSSAIAPVARGIGEVLTVVAKLIGAFSHLAGMGGVLTGLGATLGTIWAVGKIQTATMAVANFGRALLGVQALGARGAATSFLGGTFQRDARLARDAEAALQTRTFTRPPRTQSFPAPIPAGAAREAEALAASGGRAAREVEQVGAAAVRSGGRLRAAAAATGEFAGGLVGISGPAALAIGGIAALGVAIYGMNKAFSDPSGAANKYLEKLDRLVPSVQSLDATVKRGGQGVANSNQRFMAARSGMDQFASAVVRTKMSLKDAREALSHAKKGTDEYKLAQFDVRDALRAHIQAQIDLKRTTTDYNNAARTGLKNAVAAREANKQEITTLKARVAQGGPMAKVWQSILDQAIAKQKSLAETADSAWNRVAVAPIAAARATKGMVALTGQAEQAIGRLAHAAGGKKIATTIGVKYEDPNKAGQVATKARAALQSGVGKGAVMRIVADSRSADQAIRRLQAARITPKKLTVLESGGAHAIKTLEQIIGRRLTKKEQKIAQQGGPQVLALLERIIGKKLPNKVQNLTIQGVSAVMSGLNSVIRKVVPNKRFSINLINNALGPINSIISAVGRLSSKTITITTQHRDISVKGGYAGRVIEAAAAGQDVVGRALAAASARQPKLTRGGKYSAPTLLVGEENRTEYVIATNPSYRENNKRYLTRAAGDLGMMVVDAAKKGKPAKDYGQHYAGGKKGHRGLGPHRGAKHPLPVVTNQSLTSDYIPEHYQQTTTRRAADERGINAYDKQLRTLDEQYFHTTKGKNGDRARGRIAKRIERAKKLRAGAVKRLARDKAAQKKAAKEYRDYSKYKNNIEQWTTQMNTDSTIYNNTPLDQLPKGKNGQPKVLNDWQKKRGQREDAYTKLIDLLKAVKKHAPKKYQSSIDAEIKGAIDSRTTSQFEAPPTEYEPPAGKTLEAFIKEQGLTEKLSSDEAALSRARADTPDDLTDDQRTADTLRDDYKTVYDAAVATGQSSAVIKEAADAYISAREEAKGITPSGPDAPQGLIYSGAVADSLRSDVLRDFGGNASVFSGLSVSDPMSAGASWTQQNPAALNPAVTAATSPSGSTAQPSGGDGGGVTKVINQTNNFQQPPADAHTFSQGVAFELGAAI